MDANPLKQYFRKPSMYFRLPSKGNGYEAGVIDMPPNGELPVYPMTSNDEITMRTPDALFNGVAMVELIKSCMPNIRDPWKINSIDFDAILLAIRIATVGDTMEIDSQCPNCNEEGKYDANLSGMISHQHNIDYTETLKVRELEIGFKPLIYSEMNQNNLDQFEVQRAISLLEDYDATPEKQDKMREAMAKMNNMTTGLIANTIAFIKTPETVVTNKEFIIDFLKGCDGKTNTLIKDTSINLRTKNEIAPLNIKCSHCQHEYEQRIVLNSSDFFE